MYGKTSNESILIGRTRKKGKIHLSIAIIHQFADPIQGTANIKQDRFIFRVLMASRKTENCPFCDLAVIDHQLLTDVSPRRDDSVPKVILLLTHLATPPLLFMLSSWMRENSASIRRSFMY